MTDLATIHAGAAPRRASDRGAHQSLRSGFAHELHDLTRAFAGAYLFGIPLLLTMEMWWRGATASAVELALVLCVALAASFALVRAVGFKRESTFRTHVDQAVHAVAVGIVGALVCLLVLNQIQLGEPAGALAGKLVIQALPLSFGASVANAVFKRGEDRHSGEDEGPWRRTLHQVGASATGAAFVAFTVAPTQEVPQVAAGLTLGHQLSVLAFSLLVTHAIVFQSGYHPDQQRAEDAERADGAEGGARNGSHAAVLSHVAETGLSYSVALAVAMAALFIFNRASLADPAHVLLGQVLVLGVPAAIGGAAGRLVL